MKILHDAFLGAGISTAAGIGDFRGIHGKWTTQDKVKHYGAINNIDFCMYYSTIDFLSCKKLKNG